MKIFVLLFFSSFLYAQEPQDSSNNSAQQNKGETEAPQTPPADTNQKQEKPQAQEQNNVQPKQAPQTPPADTNQKQKSAEDSTPPVKNDNTASESKSTATQLINNTQPVAVPPPSLDPDPKEPIPYYNPLHPQSSSTYQEGDLPSENVSNMKTRKNRTHRLSVGGKPFEYLMQGDRKRISLNVSADYGYSRKYFEVGPYASIALPDDFDVEDQFQDKFILDIGAFFEVNFMANANHAKNIPSIGLKAGYKRKQNVNYIVGQPYLTMKFFLNHQTAFFATLAAYYQYKLQGQKGEWGVELPIGLRFYFY